MKLVDSHKSSIGFRIALLALTTLVMMPVLLRPHWGMFSDPGQIVDTCHTLFSHKTTFAELVGVACGDFRPVFHLANFAVWAICPDNPLPYFLLKWACFALTVDLTFQNAFLLSDSRKAAFISAIVWFLAYPTYEVIYTLDKGEIYLGMLFAIVIAAHLQSLRAARQGVFTTRNLFFGAIVLIGCLTLTFTKLPGNLVLAYSSLPLVVTILTPLCTSERRAFSLKALFREPTQKWRLYFFGTCVLASISFVCFYIAGEGYKHPYGETSLSLSYLWSQLIAYVQGIPEFFACVSLTGGCFAASRNRLVSDDNWQTFEAVMLLLVSFVGALALLSWKSQIAYSYYPLYSFLLPAFACAISSGESRFRFFPAVIATTFLALLLPARFVDAQQQFQMDSLFLNLSKTIASKSLPFINSVIVPMNHQASAELGEELEFMTYSFAGKQPPPYDAVFRGVAAQKSTAPPRISNVLLNSSGDSHEDLHQLPEPFFFASNFVETPGFYKLSYIREKKQHWLVENVLHDDVILIPYGDLRLSKIPYRGLSLFIKPESAKLQSYPSLELEPMFRVEKSVHDLFGRVQKIGWLGMQVTNDCKYSLNLTDNGWLRNPSTVNFAAALQGRCLAVETQQSCVAEILLSTQHHHCVVLAKPAFPGAFRFDIPLLESGQMLESTARARKAPFLMQVNSSHLTTKL
ncbi:MAG TPA: hypothetical protein V6C86_08660 [Oculatellaceae cyanobacterium]